jgi:beta-glucosidase/6-phospho-beta-glucosidase/beta-galactosidase
MMNKRRAAAKPFRFPKSFAFGIVGIDRQTLARIPKASAAWYKEVLRTRKTV